MEEDGSSRKRTRCFRFGGFVLLLLLAYLMSATCIFGTHSTYGMIVVKLFNLTGMINTNLIRATHN